MTPRAWALGLLCLVAPLPQGPLPALAKHISLAGDFGEPRVLVAAPADPAVAHLSWPKVVRTRGGVIVLAFIAGRFHGAHGEGCPAVSVSTDAGKTFSPPRILKRYRAGDTYTSAGNLALGLAEDGAVVLLSMAYNGDRASTIDGWRSPDSGRSWEPVDVSTLAHSQTGSVFGHVLQAPGNRLAAFGHYRAGSRPFTRGLWLAYSSDQGKSWGRPRRISDRALVEPAFVFTADRFIGLARPGHTPAYYTQLLSAAGGVSWEVKERGLVAEREDGVRLPSPCVVVDPRDPRRLFALVSERHSDAAGSGLLGRIDLWTAATPRLEWQRLASVVSFPAALGDRRDITYGWMTPLGGTRWLVVFYCGKSRGPSDIYGLEINIPAQK